MKKQLKVKLEIDKQSDKLQKKTQLTLPKYNMEELLNCLQTVKDWNARILKITLRIEDQYPELSKYLEEMTVTIPDEKNPRITIEILKAYYNSLNSLVNNYILEHPDHSGYEM
jgi:hypothetical protein